MKYVQESMPSDSIMTFAASVGVLGGIFSVLSGWLFQRLILIKEYDTEYVYNWQLAVCFAVITVISTVILVLWSKTAKTNESIQYLLTKIVNNSKNSEQ
jgi:H+/Cl- antiporter ClcA